MKLPNFHFTFSFLLENKKVLLFLFIYFQNSLKFTSILGCSLLLLPLFTGSICGITISPMIKSPTKNIPTGIFSALLTMFLVSYEKEIFFFRKILKKNLLIKKKNPKREKGKMVLNLKKINFIVINNISLFIGNWYWA